MNPTAKPLRLRSIRKTFGNHPVFRGFDLDVNAGEWFSIIGRSGCGKTTLIRLIAGLETADSGSIIGVPPRIGMCFQEHRLLPWRSTLDNVALPLELAEVNQTERHDRAEAMLSRVGLQHAVSLYPAALSGGMLMRAALARALVTNPDLLLLDEPCGALDEMTREEMDDLMRSLWSELRPTTVMVTHNLAEAVACSERIGIVSALHPSLTDIISVQLADRDSSSHGSSAFCQCVARVAEALRAPVGVAS
ncbi:MAG: ABC transporter ATP-binding protein [Planctomycetota bacterium]|nr:ABC transporter ATP-binding protein [Planctomycetota bacterium]